STYPFLKLVPNRQRIGHVMTRRTHLGTNKHRLMKTFMLLCVDVLVRNLLPEYLTCVYIRRRRRCIGREWSKRLENADCMGRKAKRAGANTVSKVRLGRVRYLKDILVLG